MIPGIVAWRLRNPETPVESGLILPFMTFNVTGIVGVNTIQELPHIEFSFSGITSVDTLAEVPQAESNAWAQINYV